MKITLERAALLKSLGHIQSVVERRNTIPILANVLIRAEKSVITFAATDMEIEINENVQGAVSKTGAVTAPAHMLYEIVRKLPEGAQVELNASSSGQIVLASGRSQFKLGCLPIEDFPKMPEGDYKTAFGMGTDDLRILVDSARFAMSMEETRYYLNGIYLHVKKADKIDVLRAVATDGHRLARYEMPAPQGSKGLSGIIVPRKTVTEVRKLLDEVSGEVEISLSESRIRFAFGDAIVASKLIDGTFPDYERAIPEGNANILLADARELGAAVDRVATVSSEKMRGVKLGLAPGLITLSANAPEAGSASEELEVNYDGPAFEIGFNARYLLDILAQIKGESVRFAFSDSSVPALIQDTADTSALYVLMPMRV